MCFQHDIMISQVEGKKSLKTNLKVAKLADRNDERVK